MTNINETDDRFYLKNIPRLEWGKNRENTFIRSAQLCLNAIGENFSYDYLMGISGAAFRLHFHPDWCPSAGDTTVGFDVSRVLFKAVGHDCELITIDTSSFNEIKELYQKIIAQIRRGIPMVAINLKVCPDWGIITGFLKSRPGILCRTYYDDSDEYFLAERAPWATFFIRDKNNIKDENEIIKSSFDLAVKLAKTNEFEDYKSGFAAYEYWINGLNDEDIFKNKKSCKEKKNPNSFIFNILLDSRIAAINYLNSIRDRNLLKDINLIISKYERIVQLLKNAIENNTVPMDFNGKEWTQEMRNKQSDILREALETEKEIISMFEA